MPLQLMGRSQNAPGGIAIKYRDTDIGGYLKEELFAQNVHRTRKASDYHAWTPATNSILPLHSLPQERQANFFNPAIPPSSPGSLAARHFALHTIDQFPLPQTLPAVSLFMQAPRSSEVTNTAANRATEETAQSARSVSLQNPVEFKSQKVRSGRITKKFTKNTELESNIKQVSDLAKQNIDKFNIRMKTGFTFATIKYYKRLSKKLPDA